MTPENKEIHQSLACLQGGIFKKVLGGWVAWRPRPRRPVEATWSNNHPHLSSSSPRHPILCNLGAFGDRCFLVFHCSSPDLATGLQFPSQGEVKTSEGRRTTKLLPMAACFPKPAPSLWKYFNKPRCQLLPCYLRQPFLTWNVKVLLQKYNNNKEIIWIY
ncbi:hypothetical protein E2320_009441, partial [Naja naja]